MALLFVDSIPYDEASLLLPKRYTTYATDGGTVGNYVNVETANGRHGSRWIHFMNSGFSSGSLGYVGPRKIFGGTNQTIFLQFAYQPINYGAAPNIIPLLLFMDGANVQLMIEDYQGLFRVWRNSSAALLGTSDINIGGMNTWHQVEVKAVIATGTGGEVWIKVDGVEVLHLTGQNTSATGTAYANGFQMNYRKTAGETAYAQTCNWGVSDIIVMNDAQVGGQDYCNGFLGIKQVLALLPTADGYHSDFTPSTGADNFATVDEVTPDEATFNSTVNVNDIDTFVMPDIANPAADIDAVVCTMYSKTGAAGVGALKGAVRSNSQDGVSPEEGVVMGSSNWVSCPIYVDPDTSAPFTVFGFNAAEFGYKRSM